MAKLAIALKNHHPQYYPFFAKTNFTFRNRVIQGHNKDVAEMITWVRRGPPGAQVDKIEVKMGDGIFPDFNQLPAV